MERIYPICVSGPYFFSPSDKSARDALPDIGLSIAKGKTSFGIINMLVNGFSKFEKSSIHPDAVKIFIATINPMITGTILTTTDNPSLAPFINSSNTFIPFNTPYIIIKKTIRGSIDLDIISTITTSISFFLVHGVHGDGSRAFTRNRWCTG